MKDLDVALLGDAVSEQRSRLQRFLPEAIRLHPAPSGLSTEACQSLLAECDAAIANEFRTPVRQFSRLQLLQVAAAGYEKVDLRCLADDVWVCNAVGHGPAVAEYVIAAILTIGLGLTVVDASFRSGSWERRGSGYRPLRDEIATKKVGVLGSGHIGQAVLHKCNAIGMEVTVCSRSRPANVAEGAFYPLHEWRKFFEQADYLIVCLAHKTVTEGFVDAQKLASMKRNAVLINVARGALVDEAALFAALSEKRIGGAVLDTWWRYPTQHNPNTQPSRFPFEELSNVVMTPHVSAWTEQALERRWESIANNLIGLASGRALRNVVRPPALRI